MYDFDTLRPRNGMGSAKWDDAADHGCPPSIVPLTVADMEFRSAPVIVDGLRELAAFGMWGYGYDDGAFKQSVARWMGERQGWQAETDWMVHTEGVVQAIYAAVRALTKPGDKVVVQPPVYHPFFDAVEQNGRTLVENPLVLRGARYEMDFDDLSRKLEGAGLMILCSPHNPVGRVWAEGEMTRVARLCAGAGVPLFSDEIHADLVMPGHSHYSAGRLPQDLRDNCLIATSASKTFSLAGLGCSTTFVPGQALRQPLQRYLDRNGFFLNSVFGTAATRIAYGQAGDWLDELLAYLWGNFSYLQEFLAANLPGVTVTPPEGTYLAWLDFSGFGLGGDALRDFLRQEALLFLNDGREFRPGTDGFARLNLACPRSVLEEALVRLQKAAAIRGFV